jgi:SAM-dependent methyltransferase
MFRDSMPEAYDRYLAPIVFRPFAEEVAQRVSARSPRRVLETACGSGVATRALHAALPETRIVATDISPDMVAFAEARSPGAGIEWVAADAQALPFADGSFEALVCQLGLMFLPDKQRGFAEARRVLADGGAMLATVWRPVDDNPPVAAKVAALGALFPDDPPRFFELPHGYHDKQRIEADATAGGFTSVAFDDVTLISRAESAEDYARGFVYGSPLRHELAARSADMEAAVARIAATVAAVAGETPCDLELAATIITAQ